MDPLAENFDCAANFHAILCDSSQPFLDSSGARAHQMHRKSQHAMSVARSGHHYRSPKRHKNAGANLGEEQAFTEPAQEDNRR